MFRICACSCVISWLVNNFRLREPIVILWRKQVINKDRKFLWLKQFFFFCAFCTANPRGSMNDGTLKTYTIHSLEAVLTIDLRKRVYTVDILNLCERLWYMTSIVGGRKLCNSMVRWLLVWLFFYLSAYHCLWVI